MVGLDLVTIPIYTMSGQTHIANPILELFGTDPYPHRTNVTSQATC